MIIDFFTDSNNKKATSLSIDGENIDLKKCSKIEIVVDVNAEKRFIVRTTKYEKGVDSVSLFECPNDWEC